MIIDNLKPPYYAVIFSTTLSDDTEGYYEMAEKMDNLAKEQEGYLGVESVRSDVGITVSYWESLDAILKWKNNIEHTEARNIGRERWYKKYQLRISKVEREYGFDKG
ncbi:MAG: antibiotic biosynthesis monooxygenase [Tenacibaculum sp.]|uniref:antibiotic biosynthesis monooxygenase family protein n=1 Tax=Tenacibaculum sp. TaxID=1906242 RepID=UPI001848049B|nr:antibiotic biosynthesis monooxygenase [Tenacibaculum sp.]NVK08934.1 antibiotic biosynthesis monooxygenase [Tenacibaculum sp.]